MPAFAADAVPTATPAAPVTVAPTDASTVAPTTAPDAAKPDDKISVSGRALTDNDRRRGSSAAKITFSREDIARFGDNNLGDVLKRLPGVTIGGTPGRRGGEIRMRGLGSGYTQILINGEPAARGFSMDSLSPDMIERIEVIRAPMAEFSAQAVAGTINIVLREDAKKRTSEATVSASQTDNHKLQPRINVQHSDKIGGLNYTIGGSLQHYDQIEAITQSTQQRYNADGSLRGSQTDNGIRQSRGYSLNSAPRLTWRFGEGDTLTLQMFAMHSQEVDLGSYTETGGMGSAPYDRANERSENQFDMFRGFGNRQMPLADGGKLNIRFGFNVNHNDSKSDRQQYLASAPSLRILDDSAVKDHGFTTGGKWSTPLGEGHSLALGYDVDWSTRDETRTRSENSVINPAFSGTQLSAKTLRLAGFGQDEWDITPQYSAYLGLRYETIETRSNGLSTDFTNRSGVWSPSLQGVWRLPNSKNDQVRMSVSRSYRAPRIADLMARTVLSDSNDPFSPDSAGNPNLKPELAWGAELAIEHYLSQSGLISANLFARNIDNVIRRDTALVGGRWVSSPTNLDHATTTGIELEGKFRLTELIDDAPPIDVRANLSHYWSHVSNIPGPDNRLDGQSAQSVNLGLDYRLKSVPLTIGGNLSVVPAYEVQQSVSQLRHIGGKRVGDIYALWKFDPAVQLRLSAGNLAHANIDSATESTLGGTRNLQTSTSRSWTTWTAALEMKF